MKIEFYYDFGSPNAYLVHKTLPEITKTYGVPIISRPILLGGVFKATNNKSPMEAFANVAGKLAYEARETERFVENRKIIFQLNPHFPVNTIALMRGAIFALGKSWEQSYRDTMFHAMWVGAPLASKEPSPASASLVLPSRRSFPRRLGGSPPRGSEADASAQESRLHFHTQRS